MEPLLLTGVFEEFARRRQVKDTHFEAFMMEVRERLGKLETAIRTKADKVQVESSLSTKLSLTDFYRLEATLQSLSDSTSQAQQSNTESLQSIQRLLS